ncbi:MAG: GrpB family protein [Gemmatimonadaceae bacterium]
MTDKSLGLESGEVRIVPYDQTWPALFQAERVAIDSVLKNFGVAATIEHIGSTSVPRLAAKPILDMVVGVEDASLFTVAITALQETGYIYRGEQGIPGRHFFRRGVPRQHHVHLVVRDSDLWCDYLAFRNHLRAHPDEARAYADLKHALAARFPRDRESYIAGKAQFVARILRSRD